MSFDQLHSFVVVAEERALVRAAARLHVTPAPLTRRIQGLEDELGAALFVRRARGVALTPAGEALLPVARRILAEVAAAREVVHGTEERPAKGAPPLTT